MLDSGSLATLLATRPAVAFPLVFAGGLLTSLTPCIYPMIPITAAVVGGGGATATATTTDGRSGRRRSVILTFAYVIGLALAYSALGLLAGLTGTLFGAISTNPWLYLVMANALLIFAAMMLDVLPVPLPRRILARAVSLEGRGRAGGAFAMGAASGLIAAPCGAPVFAVLLTWVAATRSPLLGFSYLFVFSLGMCALLIVVGLAAGGAVALPRAGPWMLWVKRGFAGVLVAVAEYYLIQMGQLLLSATLTFNEETQMTARGMAGRILVRRTRSFALATLGSALLMSAGSSVAGAQDGGIDVGASAPAAAVVTLDGAPSNIAQYVGKRAVVLEFWATWCPLCKQLEPSMAAAQREYTDRVAFLSVGVSNNQTPERQKAYATAKKLGGEFVFDRDGKAVAAYKVPHTSYLVVIDPSGKVVYTGAGGDQDVPAAVAKAFPAMGMGR